MCLIYGYPVIKAEERLLKAVRENPRVIQDKESMVVFNDFGDNSLVFEVYFWINVPTILARRHIESSIHLRIDELLREAGIVIAFPQRDVHLYVSKPIKIDVSGQPSYPG